jgi:hypothetical protein
MANMSPRCDLCDHLRQTGISRDAHFCDIHQIALTHKPSEMMCDHFESD